MFVVQFSGPDGFPHQDELVKQVLIDLGQFFQRLDAFKRHGVERGLGIP